MCSGCSDRPIGAEAKPEQEPAALRETRSRGEFLKLGGAGLAGVLVAGALPATVFAQQGEGSMGRASGITEAPPGGSSPGSSLTQEFERAAREYGVPVGVLLAVGYANTRWEMPPVEANDYQEGESHGWGSYGIMALVQNPSADTLTEASRLTGIPQQMLKTDRLSNILGGAALLAHSFGQERPETFAGYRPAVASGGGGIAYGATSGIGGGELFADEVFEALAEGASETTLAGEQITLIARDINERVEEQVSQAEEQIDEQLSQAEEQLNEQLNQAEEQLNEQLEGATGQLEDRLSDQIQRGGGF